MSHAHLTQGVQKRQGIVCCCAILRAHSQQPSEEIKKPRRLFSILPILTSKATEIFRYADILRLCTPPRMTIERQEEGDDANAMTVKGNCRVPHLVNPALVPRNFGRHFDFNFSKTRVRQLKLHDRIDRIAPP